MTRSERARLDRQDGYLALESDVYLKKLEEPSVYKTVADSLYEVDEKAFDFLQKCDGSLKVRELNPPADFLEYLLNEDLALLSNEVCPSKIKVGTNLKPSLRYLLVEITSRCNLACRHCYQGEAKAVDLDMEILSRLADEFEDIGGLRLIVSGGEPLLHPEFKEINQLVKGRAFRSILLSNGTLISEAHVADMGFNEVQISLDGMEEGHDYLRGKGSFQKSIRALKLLREGGVPVSIASMVHSQNWYEFEQMEEMVQGLDAVSWSIDVPSESGRLAGHQEILPPLDRLGPILAMQFGSEIHDSKSDLVCGAHLGCVQSNGIFTKCGFYTDLTGGHISEGLRKCWLGLPRMRLSELVCDCEFLEECRGGCRYRAECYNGENGADPIKCRIYGIDTVAG